MQIPRQHPTEAVLQAAIVWQIDWQNSGRGLPVAQMAAQSCLLLSQNPTTSVWAQLKAAQKTARASGTRG